MNLQANKADRTNPKLPIRDPHQRFTRMKFNWRANWEILLILVIIVVGIVITTIAAIRNKDKHLLLLPEETDYGLAAGAGGAPEQVAPMPPLQQTDFQLQNIAQLLNNNDLDEIRIQHKPPRGRSTTGAQQQESPDHQQQPGAANSTALNSNHHHHHHHQHPNYDNRYRQQITNGANHNQLQLIAQPAEISKSKISKATFNPNQKLVAAAAAAAAAPTANPMIAHADHYDTLSTEPTPSQLAQQPGIDDTFKRIQGGKSSSSVAAAVAPANPRNVANNNANKRQSVKPQQPHNQHEQFNDGQSDSLLIDDIHTTRSSLAGKNNQPLNYDNNSDDSNLDNNNATTTVAQQLQEPISGASSVTPHPLHAMHGPYAVTPTSSAGGGGSLTQFNQQLMAPATTNNKLDPSIYIEDDMMTSFPKPMAPPLTSGLINDTIDRYRQQQQFNSSTATTMTTTSNLLEHEQNSNRSHSAPMNSYNNNNLLGIGLDDSASAAGAQETPNTNSAPRAGQPFARPKSHSAATLPFSMLLNDLIRLTNRHTPQPLINPQASFEQPANSHKPQGPTGYGILQQLRALPGPLLALLQGSSALSTPSNQASGSSSLANELGQLSLPIHDASESSQHYQRISMSPTDVMHSILARSAQYGATNPLPAYPAPKGTPQSWIAPTSGGSAAEAEAMNSNADFVANNAAGFLRATSQQQQPQTQGSSQSITETGQQQQQQQGAGEQPTVGQRQQFVQNYQGPIMRQDAPVATEADQQQQQMYLQQNRFVNNLDQNQQSNQQIINSILQQQQQQQQQQQPTRPQEYQQQQQHQLLQVDSINAQLTGVNQMGGLSLNLRNQNPAAAHHQAIKQQQFYSPATRQISSEMSSVPLVDLANQMNQINSQHQFLLSQQQQRKQQFDNQLGPHIPLGLESAPKVSSTAAATTTAINGPSVAISSGASRQAQAQQQQTITTQLQQIKPLARQRRNAATAAADLELELAETGHRSGGADIHKAPPPLEEVAGDEEEEEEGDEEFMDSRLISVVRPDGRSMDDDRVRIGRSRHNSNSLHPLRGEQQHLDSGALHHYATEGQQRTSVDTKLFDQFRGQDQRTRDEDEAAANGNNSIKNMIATKRKKQRVGPNDNNEKTKKEKKKKNDTNHSKSSGGKTLNEPNQRLNNLNNLDHERQSLDAAGSGLMSKLLGAATGDESFDSDNGELDGDDDESAQERRKEELEDAEFGLVNDNDNNQRGDNNNDSNNNSNQEQPNDNGGVNLDDATLVPPTSQQHVEVNRIRNLNLNNNNNNQLADSPPLTSRELGGGDPATSAGNDAGAYSATAARRNQQQSDIEFYGHPGEETRQLKYGILGSGNYEVVNGGVYPEADDSTAAAAAINSVANYQMVRKPGGGGGGGLLLGGLPKLFAATGLHQHQRQRHHQLGTQSAIAYMPGGRLVGDDDKTHHLSSPLLDLIDEAVPSHGGGQLAFDPNLGISGTSARTVHHTNNEANESDNNDATRTQLLHNNSNQQQHQEQPIREKKQQAGQERDSAKYADALDSYRDGDDDRVAPGVTRHKVGKKSSNTDNTQATATETKRKRNKTNKKKKKRKKKRRREEDETDEEQEREQEKTRPNELIKRPATGANQFNSYQILPSKKVTIFSDQDLDSAPSSQVGWWQARGGGGSELGEGIH